MKKTTIYAGIVLALLLAATNRQAIADKVQGAVMFAIQTTKPANAPAGYEKLYPKNDGKWYKLNSSGTETEFGAGGGGGTTYDAADPSTVSFRDDFLGADISGGWVRSQAHWQIVALGGGNGTVTTGNPSAAGMTNPGQILIPTGTVSGGGNVVGLHSYGAMRIWDVRRANWKKSWVFSISGTTQIDFAIGFAKDQNSAPASINSYAWLRYTATTAASTWRFASGMYGGTSASYDTTITADTNAHTVTVRGDAAGNKLWFSLDGGTEISACASGCTITATPTDETVQPIVAVITTDTNSKTVMLDFFGFQATQYATPGRRQ